MISAVFSALCIYQFHRYGFFSGNFDLLFFVDGVECILRERTFGYELRIASKNFYTHFVSNRRRDPLQWRQNKKLAQRLSQNCGEKKQEFTLDTYIDHIVKLSPSVNSLLNRDSLSLSTQ